MTGQAKKYLFDILLAIEAIEEFISGIGYLEYEKDLKTKSAVERQLGIIGEAVNKFIQEKTDSELTNAREIVIYETVSSMPMTALTIPLYGQ